MATHIEKIINNCIPYFPKTEPFDCADILKKVGEKAYSEMQFPLSNMQPENMIENASFMKHYFLARKFAEEVNDKLQFNDEGRRLIEIGEIDEYERRDWWRRNWKWIISILGLLSAIAGLLIKKG